MYFSDLYNTRSGPITPPKPLVPKVVVKNWFDNIVKSILDASDNNEINKSSVWSKKLESIKERIIWRAKCNSNNSFFELEIFTGSPTVVEKCPLSETDVIQEIRSSKYIYIINKPTHVLHGCKIILSVYRRPIGNDSIIFLAAALGAFEDIGYCIYIDVTPPSFYDKIGCAIM